MTISDKRFPSFIQNHGILLDCIRLSKAATSHHYVQPNNTRRACKYRYIFTHWKDNNMLLYHTMPLQDKHVLHDPRREHVLETSGTSLENVMVHLAQSTPFVRRTIHAHTPSTHMFTQKIKQKHCDLKYYLTILITNHNYQS